MEPSSAAAAPGAPALDPRALAFEISLQQKETKFRLPISESTIVQIRIDWGDGQTTEVRKGLTPTSHIYKREGNYLVQIFPLDNAPHGCWLDRFGEAGCLGDCVRFHQLGKLGIRSLKSLFGDARRFNAPINHLDVSSVTDMSDMFSSASSFNQPISGWNVSNVTNMSDMFYYASSFNQPIGGWNVSKVTNMSCMFQGASSFNQPISGWNVSNVTNMCHMFGNASSFNQPIGGWNVSKVTNMSEMFREASSFNQPIGDWNVSNVTDMSRMFSDFSMLSRIRRFFSTDAKKAPSSFNQPIGGWNVSNVTNMSEMFRHASSFNQPIGGWNVSNVTNMSFIFSGASSFNQPIGGWNVSKVIDMRNVFRGAISFNQSTRSWDLRAAQQNLSTCDPSMEFRSWIKKQSSQQIASGHSFESEQERQVLSIAAENQIALDDELYSKLVGHVAIKAKFFSEVVLPWMKASPDPLIVAPKGILLYGPPGNGKTSLAKALCQFAQEILCTRVSFLPISLSAVLSKWRGDDVKMAQAIFKVARDLEPCIIFFDEVDSLVSSRENSSADNVQLISQILTEWDGAASNKNHRVLVIGATNRRDDLDQGFRAGRRFNLEFYVPPPTQPERLKFLLARMAHYDEKKLFQNGIDELSHKTEGFSYDALRVETEKIAKSYVNSNFVVDLPANALREWIPTTHEIASPSVAEAETKANKYELERFMIAEIQYLLCRWRRKFWAARVALLWSYGTLLQYKDFKENEVQKLKKYLDSKLESLYVTLPQAGMHEIKIASAYVIKFEEKLESTTKDPNIEPLVDAGELHWISDGLPDDPPQLGNIAALPVPDPPRPAAAAAPIEDVPPPRPAEQVQHEPNNQLRPPAGGAVALQEAEPLPIPSPELDRLKNEIESLRAQLAANAINRPPARQETSFTSVAIAVAFVAFAALALLRLLEFMWSRLY